MATTTASRRARIVALIVVAGGLLVAGFVAMDDHDPPNRDAIYQACMTARTNPFNFDTIAACVDEANR